MLTGAAMTVAGVVLAGYVAVATCPVLYGFGPLVAVGLTIAGVLRYMAGRDAQRRGGWIR